MDIKIGDYVRTKYGIGKYIDDEIKREKIIVIDRYIAYDHLEDYENVITQSEIIKSSSNITDLISEDDLLKIEYELASGEKQSEVVQVIKNFEGKLFVNLWIGKFFIEELEHYNKHIKSIVTKEQFDNMEYRI